MHQFRDKKQIEKRKRFIKNFILSIVFLLLAISGVFAVTGRLFNFIGKPIWQAGNFVSQNFEDIGYIARSKSSVYKDNDNLLRENSELKVRMVDYNILKNENFQLKDLFDRTPLTKDLILGNILTKPNYSPYDTIIIDIGEKSNISVGDVVYSGSDIPVGEVGEVYRDTSLIILYSNPGKVIRAMIDISNTSVELVGRGGGNFEMSIPVDLPFIKGALVYIPNIQSEIIAIIEEVISSPNDPVKKILLSSPVNVQSLKWVFVKRN